MSLLRVIVVVPPGPRYAALARSRSVVAPVCACPREKDVDNNSTPWMVQRARVWDVIRSEAHAGWGRCYGRSMPWLRWNRWVCRSKRSQRVRGRARPAKCDFFAGLAQSWVAAFAFLGRRVVTGNICTKQALLTRMFASGSPQRWGSREEESAERVVVHLSSSFVASEFGPPAPHSASTRVAYPLVSTSTCGVRKWSSWIML